MSSSWRGVTGPATQAGSAGAASLVAGGVGVAAAGSACSVEPGCTKFQTEMSGTANSGVPAEGPVVTGADAKGSA